MVPEPKVWASRCPKDSRNVTFLRATIFEEKLDLEHLRKCQADSVPLHQTSFPSAAWLQENKKLPSKEFWLIEGMMAVSDELKALLANFDLGALPEEGPGADRVEFYPFTMYEHTRTKAIGNAHFMHVAVRKQCLDYKRSIGMRRIGTSHLWQAPMRLANKLLLNKTALNGPDLWAEPNLTHVLFFSDRLKRAIEDHGWDRIDFETCRLSN